MIGYPFFYENDNLVQKDLNQYENFLIFSLDPVTENSELTFTQVSSLPILVEPFKLPLGDEFTYKFHVLPETKTIVLDFDGFWKLVSKSARIVNTLSYDLKITKESAIIELISKNLQEE